jgi:hypothetical protein
VRLAHDRYRKDLSEADRRRFDEAVKSPALPKWLADHGAGQVRVAMPYLSEGDNLYGVVTARASDRCIAAHGETVAEHINPRLARGLLTPKDKPVSFVRVHPDLVRNSHPASLLQAIAGAQLRSIALTQVRQTEDQTWLREGPLERVVVGSPVEGDEAERYVAAERLVTGVCDYLSTRAVNSAVLLEQFMAHKLCMFKLYLQTERGNEPVEAFDTALLSMLHTGTFDPLVRFFTRAQRRYSETRAAAIQQSILRQRWYDALELGRE